MARDYVARDPSTGRPIHIERKRRARKVKSRVPEGPWMAILDDDIIPLAKGDVKSVRIRWHEKQVELYMADGVRALSQKIGRQVQEVHQILEQSLIHKDSDVRIAALEALPLVAEQHSGALFEIVEVLLDDPEITVRRAASTCLGDVAATFPSATHNILVTELRHPIKERRKEAWRGLRDICKVWPEVACGHLDEIFQEDDVELRRSAAKLLRRLLDKAGAAVWDLIAWSLQDEDVEVRRASAATLRPLAEKQPKISLILAEHGLFDEDEVVRDRVVKSLNLLDTSSTRFRTLILDGSRHRESGVRLACVRLMPRILGEKEARDVAQELLRQETDDEVKEYLDEMCFDAELEGDEQQKNAFLQPAVPVPDRDRAIMQAEGRLALDPRALMITAESGPQTPSPVTSEEKENPTGNIGDKLQPQPVVEADEGESEDEPEDDITFGMGLY